MVDGRISDSVRLCLQRFEQLLSLEVPASSPSQLLIFSRLQDEKTRFRVWCGNIGAHKTGRSSLEYRLRDASHIRQQVLRLLDDLGSLIGDASSILSGETIPWDEMEDDGDADGDLDEEDAEGDDGISDTELGQIATDVVDVVNCLLRLSLSLRNPAPHDRFLARYQADTSHYEPFDTQHVRSKYSGMSDALAARLGKAISRRRQYFKYRQSHHSKLCHGLEGDAEEKEVESTVASSIPKQMSQGPKLDTVVDEDNRSDAGLSQTSFASSVENSAKIRVPPLPKEAHDGPFECPFCFMMIAATSTISWKRHVFGDLRPYVCLSEDCITPEREFARRHEWMEHEMRNHWKDYPCPLDCSQVLASAAECKSHLQKSHPNQVPDSQLDTMIRITARPWKVEDGIRCRFCQEKLSSLKQYQHHVGRHQEQLALFALPNLEAGEDEDFSVNGSNVEDRDSLEGSDVEIASVQSMGVPTSLNTPTIAQSVRLICHVRGCNQEFTQASDLAEHEKTHSRPWKCIFPSCEFHISGWRTEEERERHTRERHSVGTDGVPLASYPWRSLQKVDFDMQDTHERIDDQRQFMEVEQPDKDVLSHKADGRPTPEAIEIGTETAVDRVERRRDEIIEQVAEEIRKKAETEGLDEGEREILKLAEAALPKLGPSPEDEHLRNIPPDSFRERIREMIVQFKAIKDHQEDSAEVEKEIVQERRADQPLREIPTGSGQADLDTEVERLEGEDEIRPTMPRLSPETEVSKGVPEDGTLELDEARYSPEYVAAVRRLVKRYTAPLHHAEGENSEDSEAEIERIESDKERLSRRFEGGGESSGDQPSGPSSRTERFQGRPSSPSPQQPHEDLPLHNASTDTKLNREVEGSEAERERLKADKARLLGRLERSGESSGDHPSPQQPREDLPLHDINTNREPKTEVESLEAKEKRRKAEKERLSKRFEGSGKQWGNDPWGPSAVNETFQSRKKNDSETEAEGQSSLVDRLETGENEQEERDNNKPSTKGGLPPGWEWDYDGRRWFYRHKSTGHVQYHFPSEGDENSGLGDAASPIQIPTPEELLELQELVKREKQRREYEKEIEEEMERREREKEVEKETDRLRRLYGNQGPHLARKRLQPSAIPIRSPPQLSPASREKRNAQARRTAHESKPPGNDYEYTNPGDLARWDLDHPPSMPRQRRDSFDRGSYRPNINVKTGEEAGAKENKKADKEPTNPQRDHFESRVSDWSKEQFGIKPPDPQRDRFESRVSDWSKEQFGIKPSDPQRDHFKSRVSDWSKKQFGTTPSNPQRDRFESTVSDFLSEQFERPKASPDPKRGMPPDAKWTKISRKMVNPEALTIGKERFEVRDDFVVVLRVLSKEEIEAYAAATQVLRERHRSQQEQTSAYYSPGD